ncbi:hypothetical protein [Streptomyces sp. NPDC046712]|uniref:class III lanthionine synthetase LanKC N-terminal domain-containing protein n=1 Tax=Streptomyces sp. NPDC046712 TaxID=3154802 RepID=UPI0033C80DD6
MDRLGAMAAHHLYGFVDPKYYEPLSRYRITPDHYNALRQLLPDTWVLERGDVWLQARVKSGTRGRNTTLPAQGFKIHVSSTPAHALRLFELVVPVCVEHDVEFKAAADPVLLRLINSKTQERGYSGKFMTIYPPGLDAFTELIERLYQRTRDEPAEGPYILSDRRYRDSKVIFYRYGGFRPAWRLNVDGTKSSFLVSPSGEHVADQRLPYFHLPAWVSDPFGQEPGEQSHVDDAHVDEADGDDVQGDDATGQASAAGTGATLLKDRFLIEGAMTFSNAGGVYHGTDQHTLKPVVVKEARRLTNCFTSGDRTWDAVDVLRHEYDVLRHLEGLAFVPRPVDLFQEWEHTFLVEERVDGVAFHDFWAREEVILAPYIHREGRVEQFAPKFRDVAARLIRMVEEVHARGVVLGDLSPNNVLIDPGTLHMWFIDFESAARDDDMAEMLAYGARWGTPGFLHPERSSRDRLLPRDDWYATAMILYSCALPATALFGLNPVAQDRMLDSLVELGLPAPVKSVVSCLTAGAVEEAKSVLAEWETG